MKKAHKSKSLETFSIEELQLEIIRRNAEGAKAKAILLTLYDIAEFLDTLINDYHNTDQYEPYISEENLNLAQEFIDKVRKKKWTPKSIKAWAE